MKTTLAIACALMGTILAAPAKQETCNNETVIALSKAAKPETVIKVLATESCNFDLSPLAKARLIENNVHQSVIEAMASRERQPIASIQPVTESAGNLPTEFGVYLYTGSSYAPIKADEVSMKRSNKIVAVSHTIRLAGTTSQTTVTDPNPKFLTYLPGKDPASIKLLLIKKVEDGQREVASDGKKYVMFGKKNDPSAAQLTPPRKITNDHFEFSVATPLQNGDYVLMYGPTLTMGFEPQVFAWSFTIRSEATTISKRN